MIARVLVTVVAAFLFVFAPGCDTGDVPSPALGSRVQSSPEVPGGVLRIRISGLPRDARAAVTISGENDYVAQVAADADLELPPGDYSVNAGAFGGDGSTAFFVPDIASRSVAIAASAGTAIEIRYAPLEVKYKADVRPVSAEGGANLVSATANADGTTTLVFSATTNETSSWKTNDVLLVGQTKATPFGHAGRIVTIDGLTVVTKQAPLVEVYEQGGFHYEKTLDLGSIPTFTPGTAVTTSYGLCPVISAPLRLEQGAVATTLNLQGTVCIHPTVTFDFWVSADLSAHSYFRTAGLFSTKLIAEASGAVGGAIELSMGRFTFPPFSIGPFVFTPELDFRVFVTARVEAGVYTGADIAINFDTGFGWDSNKSPETRTWHHRVSSVVPIWPTPYLGAEVRLEAGPQFNLLLSGSAGPYLGLRGLIGYDVAVARDPLWQVKAGLRGETGIATATFINKTFRIPVWDDLTTIATSNSTPPIAAQTARFATPAGNGLAVGPGDTLYFASGTTVRATKRHGAPLWTFDGDGPAINPMLDVAYTADGGNGIVFATDFTTNIYAIDATTGVLKWKKPAPIARGLAIGTDHVYTTTYESSGALAAYAFADGATWTAAIGDANRGVAVAKDGTVYAAGGQLHAIDPKTRTARWSSTFGSRVAPAIDDQGNVYTIDDDGAPRATKPDGSNKWRGEARSSDAYYGVSIGPDGTVYVCAIEGLGDGGLRVYSGDTGATKFIVRPPPSRALCRNAPTIGADQRIYLPTVSNISVFEPDGRLAWQAPLTGEARAGAAFLSTRELVIAGEKDVSLFYTGTSLATTNWPRAGRDNAGSGRQP